ncbi:putative chitin-binding domain 3 [Diplodia seriata]|uniref:Putative chitin-binding domain 3 n=1 Tax=Diplodia seriata TaxID=420778 RepID=A0A0G2F0R3_9PEZI|nr:putative chitin-binding domain 3 [Diplodia seriata]
MVPSLSTVGVAALSALPWATAHITMKHPVPYDATSLKQDRSPLTTDQYPCKFQTYSETERTKLSVGSQYTLDFYPGTDAEIAEIGSTQGAAVHDGGSCQLSVTLDKNPTAKSVFKVFHSIQGGCPGFNQKTSSFQYQLPDSIPSGDVTFAWTWFPVSSYAPEMYMNCAPVTVEGGAEDDSAFNELPDMFVANLGFTTFDAGLSAVSSLLQSTVTQASLLAEGTLPQCLAQGEHVLEFPNPGDSLVTGAEDVLTGGLAAPKGQCAGGSSKASSSSSSSSSESSSEESSVSSSATTLSTAVAQTSSAAAGGIFAEAPASSSPAAAAAAEEPATSAAAPVAATTLLTMTSAAAQAATTEVATQATQIATAGEANSACTDATDGQVVCNGSSQYGLCNRGNVVFQDVAAGMACKDGKVVGA